MKNKHGYIYFIADGIGHIKIGVSDDPERRLKQLQTGNVNLLVMLYLLEVYSMDEAFEVEAILHRMFKDYRCNGEWFEEKKILSFINKPWLRIGDYKFKGRGSSVLRMVSLSLTIAIMIATFYVIKFYFGE